MPATTTRRDFGLPVPFMVSNAIVWISAVIVMGILAYLVSLNNNQGDHIIYELVISVLTVAFFLASFVLGSYPGYILIFNLIFSYLWLVAVAFTASDFTYSDSALLHTVEAFSFIAFFFLLFNVLYDWHLGYRGSSRATAPRTSRV
jgi:nucleoside permease NupC